MDLSSGILFDITTLLFMKNIVKTDLINNTLSVFSYLSNVFSIEEKKEIIPKTQVNTCQVYSDNMEKYRETLTLPVGNCVVHHQQNMILLYKNLKIKKINKNKKCSIRNLTI